jgi:hypothetical protein
MLSPICCATGLILYLVGKDKPQEVGRIMFWLGLGFTLWSVWREEIVVSFNQLSVRVIKKLVNLNGI